MERTLFDNYDFSYTEMYNDFVEWCECNEIDHTQYNDESEYFHNWVWDNLNQEWEDFMLNIEYDKENMENFIVIGSVGLWNGRYDIQPQFFGTLSKAIKACVYKSEYCIITEENGVINITIIHHDGRNYFSIHKLNKRATDFSDAEKETGVLGVNISACCKHKIRQSGGYQWRYEKLDTIEKVRPKKIAEDLRIRCCKQVDMYNGIVKVQSFASVLDAAKFIGKPNAQANISACALGKRKTAYGYGWTYVD